MKTSKKILSLLMAIAMVVTMLPTFALTALADEPKDHYLFAYFTGNSTEQQKIKFALSEDGLHFNAINKNDAIIHQTIGTGCARDPYIFVGEDGKYYCIATDMDAFLGWWDNSNTMVVFRSNDLVNWNEQELFDMYDMYTKLGLSGTVHCTWAPQVIWDNTANKYMIYFALADTAISNSSKQIMYYMYATDLMDADTWEAPQKLYEATQAAIDGDIMFNSTDNKYYMYYKDESQATICYCTADTLTGPYIYQGKAITSVSDALEGCNCYYINGQLTMFADAYNNGYFVVAQSNDFANWTVLNQNQHNIASLAPRHGSVINITETEYNRLVSAYGIATNDDIRYNFNSRDYVAENSWHYDAIQDTSGYTYDVMTNSGQYTYSYKDEHFISLNGSTVFINDPTVEALMADNKWTVSFDVSVAATRNAPIFALTSGDAPASSIDWIRFLDNGEVYLYKNGAHTKIGSTTMLSSVEYTMTVTYNGSTIKFYKDGKEFASDNIGDIQFDNTKSTSYVAFGWTDTCGVTGVNGAFTNVRFRNKAITASQVASETAIGSELIYRYNEGTTELNGRINATNTGNGISTTMSGTRGASYTVASWVNIGASKQDNSALYEFGNGGTNDYKQYFTLRENGILHYCWADGSTHHYFDSESVYNFAANTWYYVQVNIVPNGNSCHFRVFVNGVSVYDKTTTYGAMTTFEYNPHNFFMQSSIPVKFGKGAAHWTDTGNSYIDDFRVYTKAIDPAVLYQKQQQEDRAEAAGESGASQGADIDEAMGIYESRIARMASSGYSVMYTNLADAYEAYKIAVRDKGTIGEVDALAGLNEALANMLPFTEYTGTNHPGEGTSNFAVENTAGETYYRNVIYSEPASGSSHGFGDYSHAKITETYALGWTYCTHAYVYYPQAVLLYDGKNTPILPVVLGFQNQGGNYALNMLYATTQMDDFGLAMGRWHGRDKNGNFRWPTADSASIYTSTSNTTEYELAWSHEGTGDKSSYWLHKNGLEYTATPTNAYTCYSSTSWEMLGEYDYLGGKHQQAGYITNSVPDIDIINYKKLIDALKAAANSATNKGYLADLQEKYQAGGLEGIFKAFDSATSLDPNTGSTYFNHTYAYNASNVEEAMDKAALLCGNDIDASCALLGNIQITTETANYNRLVAAINAYEAKMASMTMLHTNLSAAYEAYLLAVQYRDAYEYGTRETFEDPTLAGAAEALENATTRMVSVDSLAWDGTGFFNTDNASAGSQNVVYCTTTTSISSEKQTESIYTRLGVPTTIVLIRDGKNTPAMPVMFFNHDNRNRKQVWKYASINKGDFSLSQNWEGYSSGTTNWTIGHYDSDVSSSHQFIGYDSSHEYNSGQQTNTSTYRGWWNKLEYKGSVNETTYYTSVTNFTANFKCYHERSGFSGAGDFTGTTNSCTNTAYVINYQPLRAKLIAVELEGINVKNYQEGGLAELLAEYDELTKIDPNQYSADEHPRGYRYNDNSYSYSGSTGTLAAVKKCADDIKAAMTATEDMPDIEDCTTDTKTNGEVYVDGELQPISNENGAYTNLKIALEEIKSAPEEQGCITNATWQDYLDAIEAARAAMATIANSTGKDSNTGKDGYANTGGAYTEAEINALATALDTQIGELYDIENSAHPLKFSYEEKGTHDGYFQCYANNSHQLDREHNTTVYADMSAYDELGIVYSTLDLTKYNDRSGLNAGKLTYNQVKTVPGARGQSAQSIVDDGTFALIEAINGATTQSGNVKTYNVTFNVKKNGTQVATNTTTYDYGTNVTLDAAALYSELGDHVCDSWDVTINGKTKTIGNFANTMNIFVQSDVTVNANYVEKAAEGDKEIRLATVTGRSMYEIMGTTASTIKVKDLNTITVDGKDYKIPSTIIYSITGWKVGTYTLTTGTTYTAADLEGYCYSEFLKLDPIVQKKYDDTTDKYDIILDGEAVYTDVPYDEIKSVTSEVANVYALVIHDGDKFIPIAYAKDGKATYEFYVVYDMDIYSMVKTNDGKYQVSITSNGNTTTTTIDDETTLFFLDRKLPFVYSFTSADPARVDSQGICSKWVQNSAATMDGGGDDSNYEITEYGTLYTRPGTTLSKESMTVENVGSVQNLYKKVASSHHEFSNQWYYGLGLSSSNVGPVMFRSYVKFNYTYEYLDDNKNPQTRVVSAIAYGDLNTVYYNEADPSAQP